MRSKSFVAGYGFGLLTLIGCASLGVQYKYYNASLPTQCYLEGQLLGKLGSNGWPDLPYVECKPDEKIKGKCVTLRASEYFKMEAELLKLRAALDLCQRGNPPNS